MLSSHLDQAPPEMQEQQKMLLNMQQQFEANAALTASLRIVGQQMIARAVNAHVEDGHGAVLSTRRSA